MNAILYWNKSDEHYINKSLEQISELTLDLIEPTIVDKPTLLLSPETRAIEGNYLFIPDLGRYYYIDETIFEYERFIIKCHSDVLMSFKQFIMNNEYIIERTNKRGLMNFYLHDDKLKELGYPYIEQHSLTLRKGQGFKMGVNEFLLGVAGAITGTNNEGGE